MQAEQLQHRDHRRLHILQHDNGALLGKATVDAQKNANAGTVNELHRPQIHLRPADAGVEGKFDFWFQSRRGRGIQARDRDGDPEGSLGDICLEIVSHEADY